MNIKRNKTKTLLVVGLLLAVAGLTLGFAAFSNTLTIKSSATVTPDASTFSVVFSSAEGSLSTDPIIPDPAFASLSTSTAGNAIINNNGNPILSGIEVNLTSPAEWVDYNFYIMNTGEYDAYLNEAILHNVEGKNSGKVCTALTDEEGNPLATQSLVDEACEAIEMWFIYGDGEFGVRYDEIGEVINATDGTIMLPKGNWEVAQITIMYNGGARADGPFSIEFGDLELVWSTVDENATTNE